MMTLRFKLLFLLFNLFLQNIYASAAEEQGWREDVELDVGAEFRVVRETECEPETVPEQKVWERCEGRVREERTVDSCKANNDGLTLNIPVKSSTQVKTSFDQINDLQFFIVSPPTQTSHILRDIAPTNGMRKNSSTWSGFTDQKNRTEKLTTSIQFPEQIRYSGNFCNNIQQTLRGYKTDRRCTEVFVQCVQPVFRLKPWETQSRTRQADEPDRCTEFQSHTWPKTVRKRPCTWQYPINMYMYQYKIYTNCHKITGSIPWSSWQH